MPAHRRAAQLTTALRRLGLQNVQSELSKLPRSLPELSQRLQQLPTPLSSGPRVLAGDFRAAQAMLARLSVPFGAAAASVSAGGTAAVATAATAAAPVAVAASAQQASVASRLLIQLLGTRRGVALAASAEQFGLNDVNLLKAAVSLAYIINRPPGAPLPPLLPLPSSAIAGAAEAATGDGPAPGDDERPAELPHDAAHWARVAAAAYATTQRDLLRALGPSFTPADVLLAQLETRDLQPAHMLLVDRMHRALVFAVRGTAALTDVLTDVTGATVDLVTGETLAPLARQLAGDAGNDDANDDDGGAGDGRLHLGGHGGIAACTEQFITVRFSDRAVPLMVEALNRLPPPPDGATAGAGAAPTVGEADVRSALQDAYRSGLSGVAALLHVLRALRPEYRDWPVLFVGHSLGAAVAAMLAAFTRVAVTVAMERAAGRLAPELVATLDAAAAAALQETAAAAAAGDDADADDDAYRHEPMSDDVGSMELPSISKAVAAAASRLDSPRSRPLLPQLSGTDALRLLHTSRAPVFAVVFACPPCLTPEAAALLQLSQAQLQALPWDGGSGTGQVRSPTMASDEEAASPGASAGAAELWRFPRHSSTQRHSHGHAGDPHQWAQRPLVTVCVLGDDMIPRTTLASVRALHDQLTDPALAAEASAHALRELQAKAEGVKDTVAGRLKEAQAWFDGNIRQLREQVATRLQQLPQPGVLTAADGAGAAAAPSLASRLPSMQQLLPQLPAFPPPTLPAPLQGALSREAVLRH